MAPYKDENNDFDFNGTNGWLGETGFADEPEHPVFEENNNFDDVSFGGSSFGGQSMNNNSYGQQNGFGGQPMNNNSFGQRNGFGGQPMNNNSFGQRNGFGGQPMNNNSYGQQNGFGGQSMNNNSYGQQNGFGGQPMNNNSFGQRNGFGGQSMNNNSYGQRNGFGGQPRNNNGFGQQNGFGGNNSVGQPMRYSDFGRQEDPSEPIMRDENHPKKHTSKLTFARGDFALLFLWAAAVSGGMIWLWNIGEIWCIMPFVFQLVLGSIVFFVSKHQNRKLCMVLFFWQMPCSSAALHGCE